MTLTTTTAFAPWAPDKSEGDTEPGEECLLNWGHTPTQYVQQFAEAIAATQPAAQGLDAQDAARYRSFLDGLKVGDKTICIYAMKDGFGTRLRTTAEIDAAIAAQAKQRDT